jgi:hypothetical protein
MKPLTMRRTMRKLTAIAIPITSWFISVLLKERENKVFSKAV